MIFKILFIALGLFCCTLAALTNIKHPTVRILGGKPAKPKQFPYMVFLETINLSAKRASMCGGSLIDKNWVLTAAHCISNTKLNYDKNSTITDNSTSMQLELTVYIGGIDRSKKDEFQQFHINSSADLFLHPEYNYENFSGDIGLIHLPKEAIINEFVQIINFAPADIGSLENEVMIVSGWGVYKLQPVEAPNILQYVHMKIVKIESNYTYFGTDSSKRNIYGDASKGKNICHGDSGGPGVIETKNGEKVVVGVVSGGDCFGKVSHIALFMRVSYFHDWINETIQNFVANK